MNTRWPEVVLTYNRFLINDFYDDLNLIEALASKDPRTKTGWSRTKRFGLGPRTGPGPDQDRKNSRNLGPTRPGLGKWTGTNSDQVQIS